MAAAQWRKARRARLLATGSVLALSLSCLRPAGAEVVTDGTLGPRVVLGGPDVTVGADLGQTRGANLFHSFQRFNIDTGGRVTFTGPDGIKNVISRVTGGERSAIDGTLASAVEGANFYLLNPAGVLFGPNARLDVKGSFHASTADGLRFADGAVFSALDTAGSTLSVAEPQAFGFLGGNVGRIDVSGSNLVIRSGATLGLSAGELALEGAVLGNDASVQVPGSAIALAAQRGAGEVPVDPALPAVARDGAITLAADAAGNPSGAIVNGPGGGRVRIEGGDILLDVSSVGSFNFGDVDDTGGVDLAAENLLIRGQQTAGGRAGGIATTTFAGGRAGPVQVSASTISVVDGVIASTPLGSGGGGPITIAADSISLVGGLVGVPLFGGAAFGASAATTITATNSLSLDGAAGILSISQGDQSAGPITIRSQGTVALAGGSLISTEAFARGAGGSIDLEAASLVLDNGRITASTNAGGDAGDVAVRVSSLQLRNQGQIATSTNGSGDGGDLAVTADLIDADGATTLSGFRLTGLVADTGGYSSGDAGLIAVSAAEIGLRNGAQISGITRGSGQGGTVTIAADRVAVDGGFPAGSSSFASAILATAEQGSTGAAGSISVQADSVSLTGGGQIFSGTFSSGDGGTVAIDTRLLVASGRFSSGFFFPSGVLASAERGSSGDAGAVIVTAERIELADRGRIATNVNGSGAGGDITVQVGTLLADGAGASPVPESTGLLADTAGPGAAGSIGVAAGSIVLTNGAQISGSTSGSGAGGRVAITANSLAIDGAFAAGADSMPSGVRATADAGSSGAAGSIVIDSGTIALSNGGQIFNGTFSSGAGGALQIAAGSVSVAGGFLDQGFSFPSAIAAGTTEGSSGAAGAIGLTATTLELRDGGSISGSTAGLGDGGDVVVTADAVAIGGALTLGGRTLESGIRAAAQSGSGGDAGRVSVRADQVTVGAGGSVTSRTDGPGDAGLVEVRAAGLLDVNGGSIETNSSAAGAAGDVGLAATRLRLRDGGLVGSSGTGTGAAGDVRLQVVRLEMQDASLRTSGSGGEGGRIDAAASDRIYLRGSEVTSNGIEPAAGASVISLAAKQIVLNGSTVTSLTGDGQPLAGSGEASLLGDVTVISADSLVAGSSSVVIAGLQNNLGSDLQLAPAAFVDVGRLLRESCATSGAAPRSTFTRGGRGGLPPSPDRPLPSVGTDMPDVGPDAGVTEPAGVAFSEFCTGTAAEDPT